MRTDRLPLPVRYALALLSVFQVALLCASMKLLHWLHRPLFDRVVAFYFGKLRSKDDKYTFDGTFYCRNWEMVRRAWRRQMAELTRQVAEGRPCPDPPLVTPDLQRRPRLLQLQRGSRPLVLVFGSAT